jgi:hypothetical protein
MQPQVHSIESILATAVEIASAEERQRYVDQACGGDAELKRRVEELIANYLRAGSFLEDPAPGPHATTDVPAHERPGVVLGQFKLLEQIGEGGMGTVWMAEQTEPIQRRVAVKVVKEGMDSKQVLARFEAERQALALMDHPHIAKVLDAGRTPSGRPYFVMELVKGQPITQYCDEKRLGVQERLELFADVCRAVQHAHQKGIIHRDIKPSNVLVAPYDGRPVVKVIDFGVAKATGQRLTDKTLFTGFGALVGTPEYMSPEQAEVNNQDIELSNDLVETMFAKQADLDETQTAFLRKVLGFYEGFTQQSAETAEARFIRAKGYYQVAHLRALLGEHGAAVAGFRQAEGLLEALAAEFPDMADYRQKLARTEGNVAVELAKLGKEAEAETALTKGIALRTKLADDSPQDLRGRLELANNYNDLGFLRELQHRFPEAEAAYHQAWT